MKKIAIGISGSSGSIYAQLLLQALANAKEYLADCAVTISKNGRENWYLEMENEFDAHGFRFFDIQDYNAPFASGSAGYDAMVICPCSAGTLGRIANGISDNLITRGADVMLKERKKLILLLRESPLNLIQIENMAAVHKAGGILLPASPSFYSKPKTVESLCMTMVDRIMDLLEIPNDAYRWGSA